MTSDAGTSSMVYVYAVGRAGTPLDGAFPGRTGVGDGPLRTVRAGALVALVSSVPYDSFGADGLKAQMEDLTRLEVLARTHHAVVEAAYECATVLPMRLATVYLDDERVTAMLAEREEEFRELLSRLEDHVELGVKVYADPREAVVTAEPEEEPAMSPGGPIRDSAARSGAATGTPTPPPERSPRRSPYAWRASSAAVWRTAPSRATSPRGPARTSPTRRIWCRPRTSPTSVAR